MFSVRELKELTARLDTAQLERQLGPFVLVQRPLHDKATDSDLKSTRKLPNVANPVAMKGVFDFEDLWVATLPPLAEAESFSIGRAPDCDVIIEEDTVSKHHARIDWHEGKARIEDLGSSNGTFLNTVRVRKPQHLADNDLLSLGTAHMFFMHVATLRRRMGYRAAR